VLHATCPADLFKRCPELMYRALTLHNNVIRKAKYANCGSTVQQEGDSYTLVFHDAFDAVAFCLQVRCCTCEISQLCRTRIPVYSWLAG
jgi:hypothetical protein